jgi:hypothetical protein
MQALMPHAAAYGIEQRHLLAVIEGCQMDLEQTRYLDFAGLQRYCHLVAGVVGGWRASRGRQQGLRHLVRRRRNTVALLTHFFNRFEFKLLPYSCIGLADQRQRRRTSRLHRPWSMLAILVTALITPCLEHSHTHES